MTKWLQETKNASEYVIAINNGNQNQYTLLKLVVRVRIPGAGAPLLSINADRSSLQRYQ